MYEKIKLNISDGQKDKIQNALKNKTDVTIRLDPNETGEDVLELTKTQIDKLSKGKPVNITLSKTQIKHNLKIEGGFLSLLAGLAARALPLLTKTILPAWATGALSGLSSAGTKKLLGDGIYRKKGGCVCNVETDGKGLYLGPVKGKGFEQYGDGLYLRKEGTNHEGKGLLLGQNSPFKNIPILGLLL